MNDNIYIVDTNKSKRTNNLIAIVLFLAVALSNLSQLPDLVASGATQVLNYPMWVILLVLCIVKRMIRIRIKDLRIIGAFVSVTVLSMIHMVFTDNTYFSSSVYTCLMISLFIFFLGRWTSDYIDRKWLFRISIAYVTTATIVSLSVFKALLASGINLTSRVYAYSSKNSVSQIIFTSIIILMFLPLESKNIKGLKNTIRISIILFQLVLLALLKSRATIIGFLVCVVYIMFTRDYNKKLRSVIALLSVFFILVLIFNDNVSSVIVDNILLAGRGHSDLDAMTSGRFSILSTFPELIRGKWMTGIGAMYFECFPLSAILQYGIVAGSIIIIIAYCPLYTAHKIHNNNWITATFFMISVGYIFNSFFEGLAPIGPGVKCYYMWLMFGILSNKQFVMKSYGGRR